MNGLSDKDTAYAVASTAFPAATPGMDGAPSLSSGTVQLLKLDDSTPTYKPVGSQMTAWNRLPVAVPFNAWLSLERHKGRWIIVDFRTPG